MTSTFAHDAHDGGAAAAVVGPRTLDAAALDAADPLVERAADETGGCDGEAGSDDDDGGASGGGRGGHGSGPTVPNGDGR